MEDEPVGRHGAGPASAGARPPTTGEVDADAVVVGTGVAGLSAALALAPARTVLLSKGPFGQGGSTLHAQGGVAAALFHDDSPELHARDTLAAGAGLADPGAVGILTGEGPRRIRELIGLGARFDDGAGGGPARGREAAHSVRRVLHAGGDRTGREILRALRAVAGETPGVVVKERTTAHRILVDGGRVRGVQARDGHGRVLTIRAPAVILATGGPGRAYLHTTNPPEATGDGLAMAARAGAWLADLEFVQFHPTALAVPGTDPLPLVSEAVRGEGARLVDERGRFVMEGIHPLGDLAPRDVVARAIGRRSLGGESVFLDARDRPGDDFPRRFPQVYQRCRAAGVDPRTDPIPVTPAAHYHMGGVWIDGRGRTSVPGLWACGEAASSGAHGANRLASNSLLEGLVFGARAGRDARGELEGPGPHWIDPEATGAEPAETAGAPPAVADLSLPAPAPRVPERGEHAVEERLRTVMWEEVGLVRQERGLTRALAELARLEEATAGAEPGAGGSGRGRAGREALLGLILGSTLIARAALHRTESRGAHFREDHPAPRSRWARRVVWRPRTAAQQAAGPMRASA